MPIPNHIWVDADACPKVIKEILFRAAARVGVTLTLVANQPLHPPASRLIKTVLVRAGNNVADHHIIDHLQPGDLVVTADVPLAAEVVAHGGLALNPRGELYSQENVGELLSLRDFMHTLRSHGVETGGPPTLNQKDRQLFANQLDRLLAS